MLFTGLMFSSGLLIVEFVSQTTVVGGATRIMGSSVALSTGSCDVFFLTEVTLFLGFDVASV